MSGFAGRVTTIPVVVPACVKPGESFYTRLETNGAVVCVSVCVWWACVCVVYVGVRVLNGLSHHPEMEY